MVIGYKRMTSSAGKPLSDSCRRLFVLGLTGLPMIIGPMLGGNPCPVQALVGRVKHAEEAVPRVMLLCVVVDLAGAQSCDTIALNLYDLYTQNVQANEQGAQSSKACEPTGHVRDS